MDSNKNVWMWISAILAVFLIASILTGGFGLKLNPTGNSIDNFENPEENENEIIINANDIIEDDSIKGDLNAPVTIVEFSDYECPFCKRFYDETLSQIKKDYIDTGKVRLVFRDFPLTFHPNAKKAAEAAECAGEQDKYFEMHDKLFESGVSNGVESYKSYARELGLDLNKFNDCLDSGKMAEEIEKDLKEGISSGIEGTPTFFINNKKVVGAQPYSVFKQVIEEELNSKS